jgi:hypothetical protein
LAGRRRKVELCESLMTSISLKRAKNITSILPYVDLI